VRPRASALARVGGQAHDRLPRPGRRGQAEAPARDDLPRAADCPLTTHRRALDRVPGFILARTWWLEPDGRPGARRAARATGRRHDLLPPGRELPARPRRAPRLADPAHFDAA